MRYEAGNYGGSGMSRLNRDCSCASLDVAALRHALDIELGRPGLYDLIVQHCPHVFSTRPVFLTAAQRQSMAQLVRAVESVVALPSYQEAVLAWAPAIARAEIGHAKGVFLGYDFHVAQDRLALIEINTNAGGAMLNAALSRAQRACCAEVEPSVPTLPEVAAFEQRLMAMFQNEWRLAGRQQPLRSIAIVDVAPQEQYLYPEFLLFQRLFERHGLQAIIADPSELSWREGRVWHEQVPIDLVYNRLTDFALTSATAASLRDAYLEDAVVLTPHPRAHALYADKRNLTLLSNAEQLTNLGVSPDVQQVLLQRIPRTERLDPAQAEYWWRERCNWFFKPAAGFAGRAAYRGDKLTRRVWQEILQGDYIAQQFVAPGERIVQPGNDTIAASLLKFDVRNYVYDGEVQWLAARLYQGQTTNFRTPEGGFASVFNA